MASTTRTGQRRPWPALAVVAALVSCTSGTGTWVPPRSSASPSAASPSAASPSASASADCVTATLATLHMAGRAGQLLMVGTEIADAAGLAATVRRYRLGGVF